jgi:AcrR family transcriptional regulator
VLAAAAAAVRREGAGVPLATIAADAGVGVGTLYRRYPSREALLAALTQRSFRLVLDAAHRAAESNDTAIDYLRDFIDRTIDHGAHLVLPLHGGPVPLDQETIDLRTEVHDTIEHVLHRGRQDGSIRPDVTALDIIVFGALLAQPLPHIPDWKLTAGRLAAIHFDGLTGAATTATEQ